MKRVLVTGGAGFIGSAVVRLAISRGYEVVNLDSLTYAASLDNVKSVESSSLYSFIKMDIRDREGLQAALFKAQPDAIIHLAAESHVDRSIDGPGDFIETNIIGTYHLLESARAYWNQSGRPDSFRFHHVSTDEVFGSLGESDLFTEETPYDPRSPYSASKASSDHLVRAWHSTYGLPVVITNCSNNYGPYQFPEKLIPLTIIKALSGNPLPVYGTGENIRDWLFVDDHADAILKVLKEGLVGRSYNIGGENEIKNIQIVESICALLDVKRPQQTPHSNLITYVEDRPGHDFRYAIDPARVRSELGWRPSIDFQMGLERTVDWYLENEKWWRAIEKNSTVGTRIGTTV